ncbi:hypothetical protein GCM10009808_26600 [Microbacterium sediminicola]|uniref:Uncharacterized protein n=1 Tax=Microbacterium sediminicola TaxID=415210 RepID=A0ABP4UKL8_9MICO
MIDTTMTAKPSDSCVSQMDRTRVPASATLRRLESGLVTFLGFPSVTIRQIHVLRIVDFERAELRCPRPKPTDHRSNLWSALGAHMPP